MPNHKFPLSRRTVLPIVAALLFTAHTFAATHKLLHSFNPGGADGADPYAGLIADAADNLYGTTTQGGPDNAGTVFQLSPNGEEAGRRRCCIVSISTMSMAAGRMPA